MTGATPRQGSLAAQVLEHLQQADVGTVLTVAEIASLFDAKERSVPMCLRPWVKAGLFVPTKMKRGTLRVHGYSLGQQPQEEEEVDADAPLQNLRAYEDGDIAFSGCTIGEGGDVLLTKKQLLQLFGFAQTTPLKNAGAKMAPLEIPSFGSQA